MPKKQMRYVNADAVRRVTDSKGWSNQRLAEVAVLDPKTVSSALNGQRVSIESIVKIAAALGLEPGDIIRAEEGVPNLATIVVTLTLGANEIADRMTMLRVLEQITNVVPVEYEVTGASVKRGSIIVTAIGTQKDTLSIRDAFRAGRLDAMGVRDVILIPIEIRIESSISDLVRADSESWSATQFATPINRSRPSEVDYAPGSQRYQLGFQSDNFNYYILCRAFDNVLNTEVRLKQLRSDLCADSLYLRTLMEEGRLLYRFSHPHIAPLLNIGECGDGLAAFLVFPSDNSTTISVLMKNRVPDLEFSVRVCRDILDAIEYLHKNGISDCEVSPATVWVNSLGAKLGGLWQAALVHGHETAEPYNEIDFGYRAPELRESKAGDPRADLYSVGVLFAHCLTGIIPRPTQDGLDLLRYESVPGQGFEFPNLRPDVELFLKRSLNRDPSRRFANAAEMRRELLRLLGTRSILRRVRDWLTSLFK